jgi:hypothetical protein
MFLGRLVIVAAFGFLIIPQSHALEVNGTLLERTLILGMFRSDHLAPLISHFASSAMAIVVA